jgi:uncharacterized protein (DUF58 family)
LQLRDRRYLIILAVLALAAWLLGGSVPRAAFFVWIALGVVDAGWAWLSLRQLGVLYRCAAGTYTAGESLAVELHIDNDGWLPVLAVTLRDGPGARVRFARHGEGEVMALGAFDGVPPLRRVLQAERGRYRLGPLELVACGPFGIASARRLFWSERTITVLPRLRPLPAWPVRRREPLAGRPAPVALFTDPVTVGGTRPLLPSDPPRRIDWKRSARTGTWQIKELEPSAGGTTVLVLDLEQAAYERAARAPKAGTPEAARAPKAGTPEAARDGLCDDAVEIAAAVAHAALVRGDALALHTTGRTPGELPAQRGTAAVAALLEALAQARPDGAQPVEAWLARQAVRLPARATLVLVTPAPAAGWRTALAGLRRFGVEPVAICVLAPGASRQAGAATVDALQRAGVRAWAARDAEDLARQVAAGRAGSAPGGGAAARWSG